MTRFDELKVGDVAEITHTITQKDIEKFVDLTGDDNKLHVNEEYAAKTSFKKPVAHGMLGASFISTIIGTKLPGDGALWYSQSLEFILPVRIGDKLTIRAEIIKKDERNKSIELETIIFNQERQKVTTGVSKVKVVELAPVEKQNNLTTSNMQKKTAVVLGATGGIGKATCYELAKSGFNVAVHFHRNEDKAKEIVKNVREMGRDAYSFSADITSLKEVNNMMLDIDNRLKEITVLINCTTVKIPAIKFSELDWEDIQKHINNQLKGAFNAIKAILPIFEKNKYGKIVHVDTQYIDAPEPHLTPYIAAKGALRAFSKSVALDLAPKGIMLNMVSPGMTETTLISEVPERTRLVTAAKAPLKRLASPEDVAKVILFLAKEDSDYLCGEIIRVNGGQLMV